MSVCAVGKYEDAPVLGDYAAYYGLDAVGSAALHRDCGVFGALGLVGYRERDEAGSHALY